MAHQGYGFCEFLTEEDAEYACKIMNQIKLWGKPIRVNKVSQINFVEVQCSDSDPLSLTTLRPVTCLLVSSLLRSQPITTIRRLRTKNNWTLVRICSSEVWMRAWTRGYYMTRLVHLG